MEIISLFDGVSCARLALEKAGIPVKRYYASEIDKYAIKVTQANRPDTIQLGNVTELKNYYPADIDLLIGGSPCQDLSIAKKDRKGLDGNRSSLFWEYVRIRNIVRPKYFILENVASMPKEAKDTISEALGVQPVIINASLVSAQNRKRLFWVGKLQADESYKQVEIPQPEDRGILLKDILGSDCAVALTKGRTEEGKRMRKEMQKKTGKDWGSWKSEYTQYIPREDGKSNTLTTGLTKEGFIQENTVIRKLTPVECERLQCMPDNWTNPTGDISNTQRYKMCGNAFNVDVVAHIVSHLK